MEGHLFLDLDHTIWDFETNAADTLRELYATHRIDRHSAHTADDFIATYQQINDRMWAEYRIGQRSKEQLRTARFEETFHQMGIPAAATPADLWEQYLQICPTKTRLMEGALETLDYLSARYRLHLITNGFSETQRRKLKHSQLEHYFETLTISEEVGWKKPAPEIFFHALQNARADTDSGRYIGDSFEADVQGGLNAGWEVFWYKPKHEFDHPKLTKIHKLAELQTHL